MPKKDEPVRVVKSRSRKHKTEERYFAREIQETYCVHPGCKFRGKRAAQGVCFSKDRFWDEADRVERDTIETLTRAKRKYRGDSKGYIKYLESSYVCNALNGYFTLDELVRIRAKEAVLRLDRGQWK